MDDKLLSQEEISRMFSEKGIVSKTTGELVEELLKRCEANPKMRENILHPSESEACR